MFSLICIGIPSYASQLLIVKGLVLPCYLQIKLAMFHAKYHVQLTYDKHQAFNNINQIGNHVS